MIRSWTYATFLVTIALALWTPSMAADPVFKAGFAEACAFAGYKPLLDLIEVPAGQKVTGVIMAGYPRYRYCRLTDRNPLHVEFRE